MNLFLKFIKFLWNKTLAKKEPKDILAEFYNPRAEIDRIKGQMQKWKTEMDRARVAARKARAKRDPLRDHDPEEWDEAAVEAYNYTYAEMRFQEAWEAFEKALETFAEKEIRKKTENGL